MRSRLLRSVVLTLLASGAVRMAAQQPAPAGGAAPLAMPSVGDLAPDFAILGATRYGVLANQPKLALSDFRGQTVVLAFFIKARTKG